MSNSAAVCARVSGMKCSPTDGLICHARHKAVATRASTGGCPLVIL